MESKFTPYQKLPKKKQREIDRAKRGSWGDVNPVTKCAERSDAYNRKVQNRRWQSEAREGTRSGGGFVFKHTSMPRSA